MFTRILESQAAMLEKQSQCEVHSLSTQIKWLWAAIITMFIGVIANGIAGEMNHQKLINELIRDEGVKLKPYKCTAGHWTIGVGRNVRNTGHFRPGSIVSAG